MYFFAISLTILCLLLFFLHRIGSKAIAEAHPAHKEILKRFEPIDLPVAYNLTLTAITNRHRLPTSVARAQADVEIARSLYVAAMKEQGTPILQGEKSRLKRSLTKLAVSNNDIYAGLDLRLEESEANAPDHDMIFSLLQEMLEALE